MKKLNLFQLIIPALFACVFASCSNYHKTIKESNTLVEFKKDDFTLSEQVFGKATQVKVLGIQWSRLFKNSHAKTVLTPLVGSNVHISEGQSYALFDMLDANQGYDVVFYPSFESRKFKVWFFYTKIETTVRARLGKLKSS